MHLVQDVPVVTLDPAQALQMKTPVIPSHQVHLVLPPLGILRKYVEKMRTISNYIQVSANMEGEFEISALSNEVKINSLFVNLTNPALLNENIGAAMFEPFNEPKTHAKVLVSSAALMKVFYFHNANVKNIVCCLVDSRALLFYAYVGHTCDGDAVFLHYVNAKSR